MSRHRAWFRCSEGCPGQHDLFQILYACPRCGALLEVAHDLEALAERSAEAWRTYFAGVRGVRASSGVWRRKEWVLPEIENEHITSLGEGHSPLIEVPRWGSELGLGGLWVKHCGTSHTGSFKDLGMTVLVSAVRAMRARGVPIRAVACASTGDTSAALAAYAAAAGVPSIVFLPKGQISPAQLIQPLASGAHVLELDTDFDGCMRVVRALTTAEDSGIYLANSLNALRIEGQKTVSFEIADQLEELPDWVIIPGGNLGNVSALGAGFKLLETLGLCKRAPRIAVAQARAANPLYRAFKAGFEHYAPIVAGHTHASAIRIGDPVSVHRAIRTLRAVDGVVEDASEEELMEAAARGDREGLFTCPHTGVALATLQKLVQSGVIGRGARVVVVSTAHGLKFTEFKAGYHSGSTGAYQNVPHPVAADLGAVRATLDTLLGGQGSSARGQISSKN